MSPARPPEGAPTAARQGEACLMTAYRFPAPAGRRFDLACLGRLAVDLYAEQVGARLEDVASFAKYLGGSSANIAFGAARLGLRAAMVSRVGDEQMGRFLLETLQREGCDTSMVQVDPERLTALALLGLKDRDTFPLLFYRENCADMALAAEDIREDFVAGCRALLVTGTHLSQPGVRAASARALALAGRHGTARVLDIDYRPVLWGLTRRGDGQTRYVPDAAVTARLQEMLPQFELLIGTEEEFVIAGGVPGDLAASLRRVRELTPAAMVVKLGPLGCCLVDGPVPERLEDAPTCAGERVEVLNVLGAGDAFAAGLLTGLLRGDDFMAAARLANACGALVVSRHACAPAMPTPAELAHWFGTPSPDAASDARLAHLHSWLRYSSSFLDRLEEVGIVTYAAALAYGLVGPVARASGVSNDIRQLRPYGAYSATHFCVPLEPEGDGYARLRVFFREAEISAALIGQALSALPPGPVRATQFGWRAGRALGAVESTITV